MNVHRVFFGFLVLGSALLFSSCEQPDGFVADNTDCDDLDAGVNPGATEVVGDGLDNDRDGEID